MNQTKKRLSIINLAISMTDIETIQLQILKLGMLKTDDKIQEIINTLYDENYAQAQALINTYIDTPNKEILQRTFQKEREKLQHRSLGIRKPVDSLFEEEQEEETTPNITAAERHRIDADNFAFFDETPEESSGQGPTLISLEEMMEMHQSAETKPKASAADADFDTLLNLKADDVMPDNIEIDLSRAPRRQEEHDKAHEDDSDFWKEDASESLKPDPNENDDFFDVSKNAEEEAEEALNQKAATEGTTLKNEEDVTLFEESALPDEAADTEGKVNVDEIIEKAPSEEIIDLSGATDTENSAAENPEDDKEESAQNSSDETSADENSVDETSADETSDENAIKEIKPKKRREEKLFYPAMSYIDQKLKNMQTQYPSIEVSDTPSETVKAWMAQIAEKGCSEEEVVATIVKVDEIKAEQPADAAQLLLICAATQSKYAHFRLARALFTGEILRKDPAEAFTIINRLALNEDYPEAICDLAQFYEHGIGITQDKQKAERLYREAMAAGIKRAENHVKRLEKGNRKRFSFFRRR